MKVAKSSSGPAPQLSKAVMGMKFMLRGSGSETEDTPVAVAQTQADAKTLQKEQLQASTQSSSSGVVWLRDKSVVSFPGRRSFGGCNKYIEKQYNKTLEEQFDMKIAEKEAKISVSDEEMLKRYEDLVSLPRGPSQGLKSAKRAEQQQKRREQEQQSQQRSGSKKRGRELDDDVPMVRINASTKSPSQSSSVGDKQNHKKMKRKHQQ